MYALTSNTVDWVVIIGFLVLVLGAVISNEVRFRMKRRNFRANQRASMQEFTYSSKQAQHGRTTN